MDTGTQSLFVSLRDADGHQGGNSPTHMKTYAATPMLIDREGNEVKYHMTVLPWMLKMMHANGLTVYGKRPYINLANAKKDYAVAMLTLIPATIPAHLKVDDEGGISNMDLQLSVPVADYDRLVEGFLPDSDEFTEFDCIRDRGRGSNAFATRLLRSVSARQVAAGVSPGPAPSGTPIPDLPDFDVVAVPDGLQLVTQ